MPTKSIGDWKTKGELRTQYRIDGGSLARTFVRTTATLTQHHTRARALFLRTCSSASWPRDFPLPTFLPGLSSMSHGISITGGDSWAFC